MRDRVGVGGGYEERDCVGVRGTECVFDAPLFLYFCCIGYWCGRGPELHG